MCPTVRAAIPASQACARRVMRSATRVRERTTRTTRPADCAHQPDQGDIVFDPFAGTGTTGAVALRFARRFIGIELFDKYIDMAKVRIAKR